MILDLQELKPAEKQYYLQHVIAPRPICFASTIDKAGNVNLSPSSSRERAKVIDRNLWCFAYSFICRGSISKRDGL